MHEAIKTFNKALYLKKKWILFNAVKVFEN